MSEGVDGASRVMFSVADKLDEAAWSEKYARETTEPLLLLQASGRRTNPVDRRPVVLQEEAALGPDAGDDETWGVEVECCEVEHDGMLEEDELASPDADRSEAACNDETEAKPNIETRIDSSLRAEVSTLYCPVCFRTGSAYSH